MNYLVHLFVSRQDPGLQVGNWMGDMVRNQELTLLPSRIREGVHMHRAIDHFSDSHTAVRTAIAQLRKSQGKYAPVVLDICFDHILFHFWEEYAELPYHNFTREFYERLGERMELLPVRIQERAESMIRYDFLSAYQDKTGLHDVFRRVAQRASFDNTMHQAVVHLEEDWDTYTTAFRDFFPDLIRFAKEKASNVGTD